MRVRGRFSLVFCPAFILSVLLLLLGCKQKPAEIVIVPDSQKNHLQRNHVFGQVKEQVTYTLLPSETYMRNDTISPDSLAFDTVSMVVQHYSPDGYLLDYYKL